MRGGTRGSFGFRRQAGEDHRHGGTQFNEDVQRGAGGVLEGVAYNGRLVAVRTLAAVMTGLNVLLGVILCVAGIGHKDSYVIEACKQQASNALAEVYFRRKTAEN